MGRVPPSPPRHPQGRGSPTPPAGAAGRGGGWCRIPCVGGGGRGRRGGPAGCVPTALRGSAPMGAPGAGLSTADSGPSAPRTAPRGAVSRGVRGGGLRAPALPIPRREMGGGGLCGTPLPSSALPSSASGRSPAWRGGARGGVGGGPWGCGRSSGEYGGGALEKGQGGENSCPGAPTLLGTTRGGAGEGGLVPQRIFWGI